MTDKRKRIQSDEITCENCGHINQIKKKENKNELQLKLNNDFSNNISDNKSLPVCIEIKHCGFWITNSSGIQISTSDENCDRNSVMLSAECLLYTYKLAFRHLLLSMRVITPRDIDAANLVPHIKVRENKNDPFSKYKSLQGKKYIIDNGQVSVKKDFITLEVDEKNDLHCTLIYSKKIGDRINLLESFKTVIQTLNTYPELIKQYSELPYFGQQCINYWYDCPNGYPFNVLLDKNYVHINNEPNLNSIKISPAGSII